jgi:ABC-2 type transport system permease protein
MRKYGVIWKYQLKLLFRNKLLIAGLIFLFVAGLYAARYGQSFVSRQQAIIHKVDTAQQARNAMALEIFARPKDADISKRSYWAPYAGTQMFYYAPSAFSSLSIGQKDNLPFYHEVGGSFSNIFTVSTTAIQNPVKLLAGNFDLSFVIVYLFPLFIIVIGFSIVSEEKELGTYTLLRTQGNERSVLFQKLLFRFMLMSVVSILLNVVCFALNGISFSDHYLQMISWVIISLFYILFWFSAVYLVISLKRSGAVSALLLGGSWVVLLLLIPSIVHRNVTDTHEKELVQSMFNSRGDYPNALKLDPAVLEDSFSRLPHPFPLPPMSDTNAEAKMAYKNIMVSEIQKRFDNSLGKRALEIQANEYERTVRYNWINPVFTIQNAFNQVAATEINNYHNYLLSVEAQETRRRYLLTAYGISGEAFGEQEYEMVNAYSFSQPEVGIAEVFRLMLPVLLMSLLFALIAWMRFSGARS